MSDIFIKKLKIIVRFLCKKSNFGKSLPQTLRIILWKGLDGVQSAVQWALPYPPKAYNLYQIPPPPEHYLLSSEHAWTAVYCACVYTMEDQYLEE